MAHEIPDTESPARGLRLLEPKPDSLTDMVFEAIREAIIHKDLKPNERLSEAKLAAQLNVSKTPVRESLLRLEHIGLAVADPIRGLRVVRPSRSEITGAYEVRAGLESLAARLAAERADEDQRHLLLEAAKNSLSCAQLLDDGGLRNWDRTFHQAVSNAAGNLRLSTLIEDHHSLTWALRLRDAQRATEGVDCAKQHMAVAEAIARKRPHESAELMHQHLITLRDMILLAYGPELEGV